MAVNPIPKGFHTVTPHLVCRNASKAIEFYQKALGAETRMVHHMPDGKVMHAELKVGDSILMLGEEAPDWNVVSPQTLNNSPVHLHIYVPDADAVYQRAVAAGCTATMPIADQFWGDRYGQFVDPFGHRWSVATHIEDLSEEEITKRGKIAMEEMAKHKPNK